MTRWASTKRETEKGHLWHIAIELIFKHTWIDALEWFIHLACNYSIYDWLDNDYEFGGAHAYIIAKKSNADHLNTGSLQKLQ